MSLGTDSEGSFYTQLSSSSGDIFLHLQPCGIQSLKDAPECSYALRCSYLLTHDFRFIFMVRFIIEVVKGSLSAVPHDQSGLPGICSGRLFSWRLLPDCGDSLPRLFLPLLYFSSFFNLTPLRWTSILRFVVRGFPKTLIDFFPLFFISIKSIF